mmetsp:Transcript_8973/g.28492  ORF Transcript_8973/g.28492 Transcript_8973/m.28492 type:complete len:163 (+) Transcript_8973:2-490(+)
MGMNVGPNREGREATNTKLTPLLARQLVLINLQTWGRLSNKKLAGELQNTSGVQVTENTVRRWCKLLGCQKRRRYIKPKLSDAHKKARLDFDNTYSRHRDDRFWGRQGLAEDREVTRAVYNRARRARDLIARGYPPDYPQAPPGDEDDDLPDVKRLEPDDEP